MLILIALVGAATVIASVVYAAVGVINDARAHRSRRLGEAMAADLTIALLDDEQAAAEAFGRLLHRPTELLLHTVLGLSIDLEGNAATRLRTVSERAGGTRRIHRRARSLRWRRRLQAAHLSGLLDASDPRRLALLADKRAEVRAVAAECLDPVALATHPELVGRLLGDPSPAVVAATQRVLIRSSQHVRGALVACLTEQATRRSALAVLAKLADPGLAETAVTLLDLDDASDRALIAEALGRQGTASTDSLATLLADPDALVRAKAAEAVGVAGLVSLGGHVGRLLADRSWEVRVAAADALTELAVVGEMVLRSYLTNGDPFARDMAQRSLDTLERRRVGMVA
jgi:hypothetical protein